VTAKGLKGAAQEWLPTIPWRMLGDFGRPRPPDARQIERPIISGSQAHAKSGTVRECGTMLRLLRRSVHICTYLPGARRKSCLVMPKTGVDKICFCIIAFGVLLWLSDSGDSCSCDCYDRVLTLAATVPKCQVLRHWQGVGWGRLGASTRKLFLRGDRYPYIRARSL
jgi:hypothetical protein